MVGIGTVLADDPLLNTRLDDEEARDPIRIIIDGQLLLPHDTQIVKTSNRQPTLVYTSHGADHDREAVSYTHLDVYKRQVLLRANRGWTALRM